MLYFYITLSGIALAALTGFLGSEEKMKDRALIASGITAAGLFIYGTVMSVTSLLA